jgi:HIV Tat-specific factor 1
MPDTSSRWDKVVILKHMFTLKELDDDPGALLDIKEDIREECAKFGELTNVTLYDKEDDGIVTIRFSNAVSARACIKALDGRKFGGLSVEAMIADGSEKFKKSRKGSADDDAARLEKFGSSIEGGDE